MAGKVKSLYVCSECGYETAKWLGKCPSCGEWNTLNEEIRETTKSGVVKPEKRMSSSYSKPLRINEISTDDEQRYFTGSKELDRVLGGGIVKGSLVLLGGDPGIGKSTILLQICNHLGRMLKILYISGEESRRQIKLRAMRLNVDSDNLYVLTETDVEVAAEYIRSEKPDLVMIDSIQTMNFTELSSSPGSVTQVRECTNILMRTAKTLDIPVIIVGHVNKDGAIAGPKVLEHIVDAVLYFEGERNAGFRVLRAVKNRFGSTNEIGVFEMKGNGLAEVKNPSQLMLDGRPDDTSGSVVVCTMEGTRPILLEIQALVCQSSFNLPRRTSVGLDYNRVNLLLAVLEKRGGIVMAGCDAYVNIAGGMRLDDPSADLGIVFALVSSFKNRAIPSDMVMFGEMGLSGEVRGVSGAEQRVREAAKMGFKTCIIPKSNMDNVKKMKDLGDMKVVGVANIQQALEYI